MWRKVWRRKEGNCEEGKSREGNIEGKISLEEGICEEGELGGTWAVRGKVDIELEG